MSDRYSSLHVSEDTSWMEDYPALFGGDDGDTPANEVDKDEVDITTRGEAVERAAIRRPHVRSDPDPLLGEAWRWGWYEGLRHLCPV